MLNVLVEENVVINDFKEYLEAEDIQEDNINFDPLDNMELFVLGKIF